MAADLVVLGEDWGAYPTSTQHLMRHLGASHRVLWVNSIGLRRPRLNASDVGRAWRKLCAMWSAGAPREPAARGSPFQIVNPRVLPVPGSQMMRCLNAQLLGETLRKTLARSGMERPVLWLSLPTGVDLVGKLGERATVYYCGDDFGALEGVDHEPVVAMEQELAHKADLVLVSHPALAGKFPAAKTHLMPHGVDLDGFRCASPLAGATAERPVAGFVGTIDGRLDMAALKRAADRLADWDFHFYGPVKTDVTALAALSNVSFKGPLPAADVPGYVKSWRVALLPYRDTAMVRACNPLKLREYLASGTPVAAIDMAALDGYRDLVHVACGEAFADAVQAAAQCDTPARRAAQVARMVGESWAQRAEQTSALLSVL